MTEFSILLTTAISIAFIHTLIGIDHYVPFAVLSRANNWAMAKTMLITFVCGVGHVASSVALGFAGIALAAGVSLLVDIESIRGEIAAYFLIAFGIVYTIYGIRKALKNKTHRHTMPNAVWGLFILFVLGPCEPLIPIIMYPAATQNTFALVSVVVSFSACTIATMLIMTFLCVKGIRFIKADKLERYSHALAGTAILACGIVVLALPI
jgi:sulfite exporter TauE/SafE